MFSGLKTGGMDACECGCPLGGRRGTQGSHPLPGDSVQHAAVSWRALGVLAFVPPFSGVFNANFSFQVTSMGFYLGFLKRGSSPPGEAAGRSSTRVPWSTSLLAVPR